MARIVGRATHVSISCVACGWSSTSWVTCMPCGGRPTSASSSFACSNSITRVLLQRCSATIGGPTRVVGHQPSYLYIRCAAECDDRCSAGTDTDCIETNNVRQQV